MFDSFNTTIATVIVRFYSYMTQPIISAHKQP